MKRFLIIAPLALAACDPASDPAIGVSQLNGHSVTVRSPGGTTAQKPQAWHDVKAKELCPDARYVSTTMVDAFTVDFLYACN